MFRKRKIILDEKKVDEILDRYTAEILPSREEFKKKLLSGDRLKIYVGADPTGKDLHLGHSRSFFLLEEFRKLGHEIVILFGGFTAMIGDPTGKDSARTKLDQKQIKENIKNWKKQISKILDFNDPNKPKIVNNNDWYSKMPLSQIIEIASNFTVQHMIERDMFVERMKAEKPIYLHEFFYPMLQGYDSVVLDVDVEIGGTDQTFNMLAGRTLLSKIKNKNKFVVSVPLLVNPKTGKKMSKTDSSYIALLDEPDEMFGKVMAVSDLMAINLLDSTAVVVYRKKEIEEKIKNNPKEAKEEVAFEVVKTYHNEDLANKARENFNKLFSKKEITEDIQTFEIVGSAELCDFAIEKRFVSSKGEFRRLIDSGAVSIFGAEKITDPKYKLTKEEVIKVGKKNIFKIKIKN